MRDSSDRAITAENLAGGNFDPETAAAARSKFVCNRPGPVFYCSGLGAGKRLAADQTRSKMQTQINGSTLADKTRELCEAILADPQMGSIRQRIDTFMADGQARNQYETVMNKGQALQEKQQNSLPLSGEEISDFEKHRDVLLGNPVARGFLDAQEELHDIKHSIQKQVSKTLELGLLPSEDELEESSCGHGCGCHGH